VKYWLRTLIGLAICAASVVAIDWALYHLIRTGNCASGGPYISARPCPPGTSLRIVTLVGGIFGGLAGLGIYATRGSAGRRQSTVGLGAIMWALLFCTLAGAAILAAFGPANNDESGARTAALVLGFIFIPMGLAPIPLAFMGRKKAAQAKDLVERGRRCDGVVVKVEDTNVTINDNPRVRFTVRAEPDGEPPFEIVKTAVVSRVAIPREGDRCTVFYDPADREHRNGVTFDNVPGVTSAPAADDPGDAFEKIEKLGELRDKGLITPAEFEEQKHRLLGEL
jgi:hypothetical protein